MARTPDKPGTYRIRKTADGGWRLSGVKTDGTRVRERGSEWELQSKADSIFGKKVLPELDDWGIPKVDTMRPAADTVASLNASLGINPGATSSSTPPGKTAEEKAKQQKFAQSMCEMAGVAWSAGTVMVSRKVTDGLNKDPVNPNPKQIQSLADCSKETFQSWFGDRELKPWQMMILLTFSIPFSMILQSPAKKLPPQEQQKNPDLKSVP